MKKTKLMLGNNLDSLKKLPDNSIDSVVTDPPYGLSFMNKKWDYDVPSVDFWKEVYRVLKPGGHVLSFGGTRTYHRMVVNIEDAGFEIRDQIMWIYGSGFPKSRNIGKDIEKINVGGIANLKQIGTKKGIVSTNHHELAIKENPKGFSFKTASHSVSHSEVATARTQTTGDIPVYEINNDFDGWGTCLKPANEPICVARKPISEKSIAENVIKWGTGGINVDGCRIGNESISSGKSKVIGGGQLNGENTRIKTEETFSEGRFPANIIFECCCDEVIKGEKGEVKKRFPGGSTFGGGKMSDSVEGTWFNDKGDIHTNPNCPCYMLDEQSGMSKSSKGRVAIKGGGLIHEGGWKKDVEGRWPANNGGGASRFFFQASYNNIEQNEYKMKNECQQNNNRLVQYVEPNGLNINQIIELIAQTNVEEWLKDKLVLFVKSALNQSEKCTMYIVANLVAIATENMASQLTQDFIQDYKNYTLIQNLAQIAEIQDNIDTTPTTQNLLKLFGSVLRVIELNINSDTQEKAEQKSELNQSNYRFAYIPKVSKKERNMGLKEGEKSNHPTVKPINLMTYLCRLVTPKNGIILDPFMGSGSTGIAAQLEGFRFCGMEMDESYFKIAEARIENYESYRDLLKDKNIS